MADADQSWSYGRLRAAGSITRRLRVIITWARATFWRAVKGADLVAALLGVVRVAPRAPRWRVSYPTRSHARGLAGEVRYWKRRADVHAHPLPALPETVASGFRTGAVRRPSPTERGSATWPSPTGSGRFGLLPLHGGSTGRLPGFPSPRLAHEPPPSFLDDLPELRPGDVPDRLSHYVRALLVY